MRVSKVAFYTIICPHCGAKITLSADEYSKYLKEVEDYNCEVLCQEDGHDMEYYNLDCPVCKGYIPITAVDSDEYGFKLSKCANAFYDAEETISIDEYIDDFFAPEEEVDDEENS